MIVVVRLLQVVKERFLRGVECGPNLDKQGIVSLTAEKVQVCGCV